MQLTFDRKSVASYEQFLQLRKSPVYSFRGNAAIVPDEYAAQFGLPVEVAQTTYRPIKETFDYQRDIARTAIQKRKYAIFADCGLGKTLMLLEYAKHALKQCGGRVLIVSPLMVCKQTVEEAARFYKSMNIARVKAADLQEWIDSKGSAIGVTNYEAIREGLTQGRLTALILDECFPGSTLIDCIVNGSLVRKRIDNILPGDKILNASGVDSVLSVRKKKVQYAIVINARERITCSPNHPFFTQRGWVCAQDIEPGDSIITSIAAMRNVRSRVHAEGHEGVGAILREVLLSEMENGSADPCCESTHAGNSREDWEGEGSLVCEWERYCKEGNGANTHIESDGKSKHARESVVCVEEHEPQTFRAWGQWERTDFASVDVAGCVGEQMDCGVSIIAGPTQSGVSNMLQARLSEQRSKSKYRSGWNESPQTQSERHKAGCDGSFVRVESLEVLECGHPELDQLRDADGELYFYDIEAERHPSFSVAGLLVHNSSMLKSHYGAWGTRLIELGRGLEWKLCATGTPAPNDRIEFANHAVFLDRAKTVNEFLATYFINRGETQNRWELKPHALKPFYRSLADWSIFLTNPAVYGWKDNVGVTPPIIVHVDHIELTDEQRTASQQLTGNLLTTSIGGIGTRGKLSQIAKGKNGIASNKNAFIRNQVDSWPDESTIIWCRYNDEQEQMEKTFPDAVSVSGDTPEAKREAYIDLFKSGEKKVLITKMKILGFGLNLQVCTRQIFSGLSDSYEEYYQAIKRSNRIGSTRPLNVHIPVTELEVPFIENVLRKAGRVESDTNEQMKLFKEIGLQR